MRAFAEKSGWLVAVLVAGIALCASASAVANEYRLSAGGDHDWVPTSGGQSVTSAIPVTIEGTMRGPGEAVYLAQSGPGIARARQVGSFQGIAGFTPRFNPILQAHSIQELIVSGPGTQVSTRLNVHVDGGFTSHCPGNICALNLTVQVVINSQTFETVVTRQNGVEGNTLGLTVEPITEGYLIYGDVQTPLVSVPVNTPFLVTVKVTARVSSLGSGTESVASWDARVHDASFAPTGPVLDLPDGYSVSGENVSDNAWTAPFTAPASVAGAVVYDFDGDGIHDPSETMLEGITVFADMDGNGEPGAGEPSTVTDANGRYVILGLAPDTYTLDYELSDLPVDFSNTGTKPLSVTVGEGEHPVGLDFFVVHATPALVADYRFADTRASSVGTPPDLVDIGAGNTFVDDVVDGVSQRVLEFPLGNGLALAPTTGVFPNDQYTIVMDTRFDAFPGFGAQLLDFKDGTVYFEQLVIWRDSDLSGALIWIGGPCTQSAIPLTPVAAGQWYEVALSRDSAGFLRTYLDGVEQMSCDDSSYLGGVVSATNVLKFFRGHEFDSHGSGAVGRIRLFNNAMTVEELAVLDAPGPSDVVITDCGDPLLGQLTTVDGDLIIENLSDCDAIDMSSLTTVTGDLVIRGTSANAIDMSSLTSVTGSIEIVDNAAADVIDMSSLTTVTGNLVIEGNTSANPIDMGSLTTVSGSIEIVDNAAADVIDMSSLTTVTGNLVIEGNTSANPIDMSLLTTVSGSIEIVDNAAADVIDMSSLVTATGSIEIVDNAAANVVDMSSLTTVTGDLTIETTGSGAFAMESDVTGSIDVTAGNYTEVNGMTAGGATGVQIADGEAVMRVELPDGSFDSPVAFSIIRLNAAGLDVEMGTNGDGDPATIDPISAYEFSFDIPTLNLDATLTFEIHIAALDATTRDALLAALAAGTATLATRGDQPPYQAFPVCVGAEPPTADGCVSIEQLDGAGQPTTAEPVIVRFTGVTGHFSTWAVAIVGAADSNPPLIDAHGDVTVEATGPDGAIVAFTVPTATDDEDGAVAVTCAPASGSLLPLGSTTISCSAQDASGNSATSSFQAVVQDTTAPTIATPADITVNATGQNGAPVSFEATASDAVDGVTPASCTPASGSQFAVGPTVVTCGKTDAHGNPAVPATFNVTVLPLAPPDTSISGGPANGAWTISKSATFTLVSNPTGASFSCTLDGSALSVCASPLTLNALAEGSHTLAVAASGPGGVDGSPATRTWQVDSIVPVVTITTPASGAVFTQGASVTPSVTCTDANLATCTNTGINTATVGVKTLQATATDLAGNTATASVTYEVQASGGEVTKPTVELRRPLAGQTWRNDRLVAQGSAQWPAIVFGYVTVNIRATDDVGVASVSFRVNGVAIPAGQVSRAGSTYSFRYRPTGLVTLDTITYTATDGAGNATTGKTTVLGFR